MRFYRVKDEFVYNWTNEDVNELVVTEKEIEDLAKGWAVPIEELMKQVEEEKTMTNEREIKKALEKRVDEIKKNGGLVIRAKDDDGKNIVDYILINQAHIDNIGDLEYFTALAICPTDPLDFMGWIPVYEITWYPLDDWLNGSRDDEGSACNWSTPDDIQRLATCFDPIDGTYI